MFINPIFSHQKRLSFPNILIVMNKLINHFNNVNCNYHQIIIHTLLLRQKMYNKSLTKQQQTGRVAYLGFSFLLVFTAFNSLQNTVSSVYQDNGYGSLGQVSVLVLYFFYGIATFLTPYFIRTFGYKKIMFLSSLGYATYEAAGLIITVWDTMPKGLGWFVVLLGAALCGISASMIWVAQGSYVSNVAGEERKTQLFGLFWSLMMSSQIIGGLITAFALGLIGRVVYFIILTVLGVASAFLFILLPDVQSSDGEVITVKKQANKIWSIIKDPKYRILLYYYTFSGLCVAFYATFLSKLVKSSQADQGIDESQEDYNNRINLKLGYVLIALGVSQAITGLLMNRFFEKFCKFKLAITATTIVQIAGFVSVLCYFLNEYGLCFAVSIMWGTSESFIQTNTGALIGILFPGKVQSFSVFRIFLALGTVLTVLLNILLSDAPQWIFITIVVLVQVIASITSVHLKDLKINGSQTQKNLIQPSSDT